MKDGLVNDPTGQDAAPNKQPRMIRLSTAILLMTIVGLLVAIISISAYAFTISLFTPESANEALKKTATDAVDGLGDTSLKQPNLTLDVGVEKEVCLGDLVTISWAGDKEIESVSLLLRSPNSDAPIGEYPLGFQDGKSTEGLNGSITWKAGKYGNRYVEEGYLYRVGIQGRPSPEVENVDTAFTQTKPFTIRDCDLPNQPTLSN